MFWNAERLKYAEPSRAMLAAANADILILCELDLGMARTGNRHTIADLASALGAGFVFAAEFVELGLGDLREQAAFAGMVNAAGLHGAGFVSKASLSRPALVRLETSGRWFDGAFDERRVGGRIAVLAECALAGRPVVFVSAHYESHTDPADRVEQTRAMLDAIDAHAPKTPVLIGGDFNTSTFTLAGKRNAAAVAAAIAADPKRLVRPEPYEPMFELLRSARLRLVELQRAARADAAHPARRHAAAALRQDRLAFFARAPVHGGGGDSGGRWGGRRDLGP